MRNRLRKAWTRVRSGVEDAAAAVASQFGRDEILIIGGLSMTTAALWPHVGRSALLAPGLVLLWMSLPPRVGFVIRETARAKKES